jgi:hypothetical protein
MNGKTDDQALWREFPRPQGTTLMTTLRDNSGHLVACQQMINALSRIKKRGLRQPLGQMGEPRPGVIQDVLVEVGCASKDGDGVSGRTRSAEPAD